MTEKVANNMVPNSEVPIYNVIKPTKQETNKKKLIYGSIMAILILFEFIAIFQISSSPTILNIFIGVVIGILILLTFFFGFVLNKTSEISDNLPKQESSSNEDNHPFKLEFYSDSAESEKSVTVQKTVQNDPVKIKTESEILEETKKAIALEQLANDNNYQKVETTIKQYEKKDIPASYIPTRKESVLLNATEQELISAGFKMPSVKIILSFQKKFDTFKKTGVNINEQSRI